MGGFTLMEVLAVVAIIAILSGLLLPAILLVRSRARTLQARTDVKTIEAAWRRYYTEYGQWPTWAAESNAYAVADEAWRILKGENPKNLIFLQLHRLATKDNPVNPWWTAAMPVTTCQYFVQFDVNLDNAIDAGTPGNPATNSGAIRRTVVVWTRNPKEPDDVIWSWTP
jgi:prepilin-type N-terminal cleavage/methylation domain-containing protein